jgi:hypothetical protein
MYDKVLCPHCKTRNLVYLGDWEDDTSPVVEAAQCYACNQYFLMGDEFAQREMLEEIVLTHLGGEEDCRAVVATLLSGGATTVEGESLTLAQFLEKYAFSNKGEACQ